MTFYLWRLMLHGSGSNSDQHRETLLENKHALWVYWYVLCLQSLSPVSWNQILSPLLGDKVDYGIGLSYRPARLTTTICLSQLYPPGQGLWIGPLYCHTSQKTEVKWKSWAQRELDSSKRFLLSYINSSIIPHGRVQVKKKKYRVAVPIALNISAWFFSSNMKLILSARQYKNCWEMLILMGLTLKWRGKDCSDFHRHRLLGQIYERYQ